MLFEDIENAINELCLSLGFKIEKNRKWEVIEEGGSSYSRVFPLSITENNRCIILFDNYNNGESIDTQFANMYDLSSAPYLIIYKDGKMYGKQVPYHSTSKIGNGCPYEFSDILNVNNYVYSEVSTNNLIAFIRAYKEMYTPISNDEFVQIIRGFENSHKTIVKSLEPVIKEIERTNDVVLNINDDVCYLCSRFERQFMLALLGEVKIEKELYRCTSMASLKRILCDKEISMASITSMNDPTETYYASEYIKDKEHSVYERIGNNPFDNTDCFIMSCFEGEHDSLLMWRLYGDDAKGVELCFEQNQRDYSDFTLARVRYAKRDKSHSELNFLCKLLKKKIKGRSFILRRWYIWQHFFKPYEYKEEREVRVLYIRNGTIDDKKIRWVQNEDTGILFPLLILSEKNKDEFPLQVKSITLGPKCPEKNTNSENIKTLVKEHNTWISSQCEVKKSEINNYR